MKLKFWGTRGSIATPGQETVTYGGNTTCVELTSAEGHRIVIDAGSGIRMLGEHIRVTEEPGELYLLVTHIHWDHLLGFPFFSPIHDGRWKINVDGYPTCMKGIRYPFDNQMGDGFFPISFEDLEAEITYLGVLKSGPLRIGEMVIDKVDLTHPQGGFGFRFREHGKILVFITDNELPTEGGASRLMDKYIEFSEGADILIHDAQYTPDEFPRRRGWGHSNYEDAVRLAMRAGVRKLILFHHDPCRTDKEVRAIVRHCNAMVKEQGSRLEVDAAKEGAEIIL